jgi:hypothetical protein
VDLQQPQPQRVQLLPRHLTLGEPAAERVEQHVRRRVEQQAEQVGPEAVAGLVADEAGALEVLDLVLRCAEVSLITGENPMIDGGHTAM